MGRRTSAQSSKVVFFRVTPEVWDELDRIKATGEWRDVFQPAIDRLLKVSEEDVADVKLRLRSFSDSEIVSVIDLGMTVLVQRLSTGALTDAQTLMLGVLKLNADFLRKLFGDPGGVGPAGKAAGKPRKTNRAHQ